MEIKLTSETINLKDIREDPSIDPHFLDTALNGYRGNSISRYTLCLILKFKGEASQLAQVEQAFAPYLRETWELDIQELLRLSPLNELKQIGNEALARTYLGEALKVSPSGEDFPLVAKRLRACSGKDSLEPIFDGIRFLIEVSGDDLNYDSRLAHINLLRLTCSANGTKTIGKILADSIFRRTSTTSNIPESELIESASILSTWDISEFIRAIFQEVYQSSDSEELTRFHNIIETLVLNGVSIEEAKPPWGRIKDFKGAIQKYLEVILLNRTELAPEAFQSARQACKEQGFSFIRLIEPLLYTDEHNALLAEECLEYLRSLDSEAFKQEPLQVLGPIGEVLISRGLIGVCDDHTEFTAAVRLLTSSNRAAALACVSLISLIMDKGRQNLDYLEPRNVLSRVWKHAVWDESTAKLLKLTLSELSVVTLADFLEQDLPRLIFYSIEAAGNGMSLVKARVDETLSDGNGEIRSVANCMAQIREAKPKNPTEYFRVVYEPIISKSLREGRSLQSLIDGMNKRVTHIPERLRAIADIFAKALEEDNEKGDCLKLILNTLEQLQSVHLATILESQRLRDRLDARAQLSKSELCAKIESLFLMYERTIAQSSDDGA